MNYITVLILVIRNTQELNNIATRDLSRKFENEKVTLATNSLFGEGAFLWDTLLRIIIT